LPTAKALLHLAAARRRGKKFTVFPRLSSQVLLTSPFRRAYTGTGKKQLDFQADLLSAASCSRPRSTPLMVHRVATLRYVWAHLRNVRLPRSGPLTGALGRQLSALKRRRRLRLQQEDLQAGLVDYQAMPPYPLRPRLPS
jgi:hypothetical protein